MNICPREDCVGCGVCALSCTKGAIVLKEDGEGFLRPHINNQQCVTCGLCKRVCPVNASSFVHDRINPADCYGGAAIADSEIRSSTSGGVASVLARRILAEGGVVFGAAYDPFPTVAHIRVDSADGIDRLKGSKYVESDITRSLPQVKEALDAGREVLFVGLPCHVAALYGYLGCLPAKLYTVDLVCHGKPPQRLYSHWISVLQKRLGKRIVEYRFRDKQACNWNDSATYRHFYRLEDGTIGHVPVGDNWYSRYFLGSSSFRPSCYRCKFAKIPRIADITLADFWGAERDDRFSRFVKDGLSLVSVQSAMGRDLLTRANESLDLVSVTPGFALRCNRGLDHASKRTIYRRVLYRFVYWPEPLRRFADVVVFWGAMLFKRVLRGR